MPLSRCHFHLRPCFTLQFHCGSSSHHFRCDPALSEFASKCQGESHAVKAALCDLGDPGGGIPGFCIELCCFPHPLNWPLWFCGVSCFVCFLLRACVIMAHKMSLCMHRDDTKLSPPAFMDLFHP